MGTILFLVGWLACGVIAAGWAWADVKDWGLFWIYLIFGPVGLIAMVISRFIDQEAHGWVWPPRPHRPKIQGHWFKKDERRFY